MIRVLGLGLLWLASGSAQDDGAALTARQVVEQIKANIGVPWREQTVDTFKTGNPDTPVTGIATTMMATYGVLQRAARAGTNLVITHEPTFYNHLDNTEEFQKENDRVWSDKEKFIRDHNLVVWRFHDHWHMRRPEGILEGMTNALGWNEFQNPETPALYTLPESTLESLARSIQQRLRIVAPRVVGNRDMKVTRVAMVPGASGPVAHRRMLRRDDVEVLVIGEVPEWETIEYVSDAVAQGKRKALILTGHVPSEQAGMENCAAWLTGFLPDMKILFIPTAEPFWAPVKQ